MVLWREDTSVLNGVWNTYNVVVLPDLNNDAIPELLLAHGGDPSFPAAVSSTLHSLMFNSKKGSNVLEIFEIL